MRQKCLCVCIADTKEMCECLKDYLCQANIYRKQGNEVTNDIVQAPVVLLVTLHKSFIGTAMF